MFVLDFVQRELHPPVRSNVVTSEHRKSNSATLNDSEENGGDAQDSTSRRVTETTTNDSEILMTDILQGAKLITKRLPRQPGPETLTGANNH